jgi:hypothetical protein
VFFGQLLTQIIKIFSRKRGVGYKNDISSERSEDGLSFHACFSIPEFLTKSDFLRDGGAIIKCTKEKNGLLFLSESICHSKIYSKFIERRANLRMESSSAVTRRTEGSNKLF